MSEQPERESKSLPASENKIRQAREKGNTPFSKELSGFIGLLAALVVIELLSGRSLLSLYQSLGLILERSGEWRLDNGANVTVFLVQMVSVWGLALAPIIGVLTIAGIVGSTIQNSPTIAIDRITPRSSRISITSGFSRLFGIGGAIEFGKALFKLAILCTVGTVLALKLSTVTLNALYIEPLGIPDLVRSSASAIILGIAMAALFLALADLAWSRLKWLHDLKMTFQEVRDEQKQLERDPTVKAKMRSLALSRSRRRMLIDVSNATLVVVNPTHFAVALRYEQQRDVAPVVVAKGQDHLALRIRRIAEEKQLPVFEDKALARSLYDSVEVQQQIPPQFYKAVAELVIFVNSKRQPGRSRSQ